MTGNLGAVVVRRVMRGVTALLIAGLVGCAAAPAHQAGPGQKDLLSFLKASPVTQQEVRARLGEPTATFESARVLAYRLGENRHGYFISTRREGWAGVRYDLMLVFDDQDRLVRHELVGVR